jgi:hypothetical protein
MIKQTIPDPGELGYTFYATLKNVCLLRITSGRTLIRKRIYRKNGSFYYKKMRIYTGELSVEIKVQTIIHRHGDLKSLLGMAVMDKVHRVWMITEHMNLINELTVTLTSFKPVFETDDTFEFNSDQFSQLLIVSNGKHRLELGIW